VEASYLTRMQLAWDNQIAHTLS